MNPHAELKRTQLMDYTREQLEPHDCVRAVVAIGSVANGREVEGIQLDLHRLDLARWRSATFAWPEHNRAGLADGWVVFDRTGNIDELIRDRAVMSDADRLGVLDEVLVDVDAILRGDPKEMWVLLQDCPHGSVRHLRALRRPSSSHPAAVRCHPRGGGARSAASR